MPPDAFAIALNREVANCWVANRRVRLMRWLRIESGALHPPLRFWCSSPRLSSSRATALATPAAAPTAPSAPFAAPVAVSLTARTSDADCFGGFGRFGGSRLKKNFPSVLSGSSESERPSIFTAVKPSTSAWCTLV